MAIYMWREYIPKTFTISWTEQSDMSSGWTYSDDAAGLTAGDGAFDDFFGYSAVLLNTSGVETAEMIQSGGVFTGAMTTLGNITSGDNVMIKFPVRGIKMTKSGSTVTLSITEELNKTGYKYFAHCTGTLSSPGTPKNNMYIGAYKAVINGSTLKSWSGYTPTVSQKQSVACTTAKNNGSGYNIIGFYQRMYVNALYMMKYGNPNSQSTVGMGYVGGSSGTSIATGGTNNQTSATYGTSSDLVQCKLFGLEDWWGSVLEWLGGAYTNSSKYLYTQLSGYSGTMSGGASTGSIIAPSTSYFCLSTIAGTNNAMFAPTATVNNGNYNTYYCDQVSVSESRLADTGGFRTAGANAGAFFVNFSSAETTAVSTTGSRIMYLQGAS